MAKPSGRSRQQDGLSRQCVTPKDRDAIDRIGSAQRVAAGGAQAVALGVALKGARALSQPNLRRNHHAARAKLHHFTVRGGDSEVNEEPGVGDNQLAVGTDVLEIQNSAVRQYGQQHPQSRQPNTVDVRR